MGNLMTQLKKYAVLRGIIYILFGCFIVANPRTIFQLAVYLISAYIAIMGVFNAFEGWKVKKQTNAYGLSFLGGAIQIIFAGFILVFAKGIVSILPIFLGFIILIVGMSYAMQALNLRNYVNVKWVPMMVYSALLIVGGFVILFNPFKSTLVLFQMFGAILIFMGIGAIASYFQLRKIGS